MSRHFEYHRFVHCYKTSYRFYVWEYYDETDDPGVFRMSSTDTCPFVTTKKNERPRCNGKNEGGAPCVYTTQRPDCLVPEYLVPAKL